METPLPGIVCSDEHALKPAFERWPEAATSLRGVDPVPLPDGFEAIPRPLSTILEVANLDERVFLWPAGDKVRECSIRELIRYLLDKQVHESELMFVFASDYSWYGAISDEDMLFLYGDWERA